MVPTVADDKARLQPGLAVLADLTRQSVGTHAETLVDFEQPQILSAEPGNFNGLFDGRMGLGRSVGDQASVAAALVGLKAGGALAGSQQGAQHRTGGGVLDHGAPCPAGLELAWQSQQVGHPVKDMSFEFGASRAGGPQHALHAQTGGEQLTENGGAGVVGREEGEKVWGLPMGDTRQDQFLDIGQDGFEGFTVKRGRGGERGADLPRLDRRHYGQGFDPLLVFCNPIHDRVAPAAKFIRGHVEAGILRHTKVSIKHPL